MTNPSIQYKNAVVNTYNLRNMSNHRCIRCFKFNLFDVVRLMCVNPRKILGLPGGSLEAGKPADITLFDPDEEWVVEPKKFKSKSQKD